MEKQLIKMLSSLSEEKYDILKTLNNKIITFSYLQSATRDEYIEKYCDYLKAYELSHKVKDNDLFKVYVDKLTAVLNIKVVKKSRAEMYREKMRTIEKNIKKINDENLLEKTQDFSRIFVSLFTIEAKNKEGISDIDFELSMDKLTKSIEKFKTNKNTKYLFAEELSLDEKNSSMALVLIILETVYLYMIDNKPENEEVGGIA